MANGSAAPRGGLAAVLTVLAVIGLFAFVAIAINTFDTEEDVQAARTTSAPSGASEPAPAPAAPPEPTPAPAAPPVGGVATGGGGTATDGGSLALPVAGVLGALTLLAAARMVGRPREA